MNNTLYTNAIAFVLFIRFCVLPGLSVNFISIEIFSNKSNILPNNKINSGGDF